MTNKERLNSLSDEEYRMEMTTYNNCTVKNYVDYEGWLNSSEEEYPIIGEDAILHEDNGNDVKCKLVGSDKKMKADYARLVVNVPGLHNFKSILVPMDKVTVLSQASSTVPEEVEA